MKKLIISLIVLVLLAGAGAAAYYYKYGKPIEPEVSTLPITRGDIIQKVGGTGTIEAVITVDVGTQVNGIIKELYADFNSIVKKGMLIAKIDPATIEAKIQQDNAQLESAMANMERQKVALEDSRNKLRRAEDLFKRNLVTQQDLETAQVNFKTAEAQIKAQEASITQVKATLNQDQVNLGYTNIYAPIDGIVINRKVDIGQTVVSNNAATSMFQIAADLSEMQVKANIDESDVGLIRPGQRTSFTVDAFPGQPFTGTVSQVRLQPVVQQNVVTYVTIISVPNPPPYRLKPGMTAQVNIEIARRENVLRVPNAAIRFRPTEEIFAALKQDLPAELKARQGGRGQFAGGMRGGMGGGQDAAPAAGAQSARGGSRSDAAANRGGGDRQSQQPADQRTALQPGQGRQRGEGQPGQGQWQGRQGQGGEGRPGMGRQGEGGQPMTDEQRRQRREQFMAQMTPEQRAQFEARMREGGFGRGMGGERGQGGAQGQRGDATGGERGVRGQRAPGAGPATANMTPLARALAGNSSPNSMFTSGAETIDALFGPLPSTETRGRVWIYGADKKLKAVNGLRLGITDGTFTELIEGQVDENTKVVSGVDTGQATNGNNNRNNMNNPLMPGRPGMGGPGGFRGGGPGGH